MDTYDPFARLEQLFNAKDGVEVDEVELEKHEKLRIDELFKNSGTAKPVEIGGSSMYFEDSNSLSAKEFLEPDVKN